MNLDRSDGAIRERYDRANRQAIVCMDKTMFDSISDIFYLLEEKQKLELKIKELILIIEAKK